MDRKSVAARLTSVRGELSGRLAAGVADWPKYAAEYAADPAGFADLECGALVDYIAAYIANGDATFQQLYIGEKAKQFHDPATDAGERRRREAELLQRERQIFVDAVGDDADAQALVSAVFDKIGAALTTDAEFEVSALFVGDCLYLDVIAFLTAPLLTKGIRLRPTFVTSHDPTEIQSSLARLADQRFDIAFLSPFTYAFLADYEALQRPRIALNPRVAARHAAAAVNHAELVFDTVTDLFDCPIVAHLPVALLRTEGSARERLGALLTAPARKRAVKRLRASLGARASALQQKGRQITLLDEEQVVADVGLAAASLYYHRLALQHPARFGALVADEYADILFAAAKLLKRKVVVCDLDDTLWQGVIGEGLGIAHHYDRQAPLLRLKQRGVLLAINSKNDPAKVTWPAAEGRLCLDDFVSRQINWEPKALNMRRIAEHLNLKEKDFVFVDDRADERSMMNEVYPQILTLDSLDPQTWRALAAWADLLPATPDADRTEFYRQRDARGAFIEAQLETGAEQRRALYAGLDLRLTIREAREADLVRVAELINRTNQFNMTGARITRRRVEELAASDEAWILIGDAADRFGSMGTISVLIAKRSGTRLCIPVFVLSCRVFGYGIERAMLEATRALSRPGDEMFGPFEATEHNQPCHDVYPAAGWRACDGGFAYERAFERPIEVPDWLGVESGVNAGARSKKAASRRRPGAPISQFEKP